MLKVHESSRRNFVGFMSSFKCVCSLFLRVTVRVKLIIFNVKTSFILFRNSYISEHSFRKKGNYSTTLKFQLLLATCKVNYVSVQRSPVSETFFIWRSEVFAQL